MYKMYVCIYVCMHACMHACMHVNICVYVYMISKHIDILVQFGFPTGGLNHPKHKWTNGSSAAMSVTCRQGQNGVVAIVFHWHFETSEQSVKVCICDMCYKIYVCV